MTQPLASDGRIGKWLRDLVDAIARNPDRAMAIFLIGHLVLWTAVPALLCRDLPLDVIEGVAYGRDWQLGYWKHPPLPWWLIDLVWRVFGAQIWAYFLLGAAAAALAMWAIWKLGREILTPLEAFAAVLLLDGCIAFNIYTVQFNHNILQLPFFGLAGWSLYRALIRHRLLDWTLVGVWFALSFWTKYEAIVLLVPALVFTLIEPRARQCWRTPGPYLAAAICAVLFAPHLVWMIGSKFSGIAFVQDRAEHVSSVFGLIAAVLKFCGGALLLAAPMLILFAVIRGRPSSAMPAATSSDERFARLYLACLAIGPLVVALIAEIATARQFPSTWSTQFWCFLPLFLLAVWRVRIDRPALRRAVTGWGVLTAVLVGAQTIAQLFLIAPGWQVATVFPGADFAAQVNAAWRKETGTPLRYLIGHYWTVGNVMLFSPRGPRMLEEGNPHYNPTIDLADLRRRGAVIFTNIRVSRGKPETSTQVPSWAKQFAGAEPRAPFVIHQDTLRGEQFWTIGWSILKPEAAGND